MDTAPGWVLMYENEQVTILLGLSWTAGPDHVSESLISSQIRSGM